MKKIISTLIGMFLLTFCLASAEVHLVWDANVEPDLAGYKLYQSTDYFSSTNRVVENVGNITMRVINVENGPLYSLYVTAYNTSGLESRPSNQIRYQRLLAHAGRPNTFTLLGATNWSGARLINSPTNGILSGTLPTITYTPTNTISKTGDVLEYEIQELWEGYNITNYYSIRFVYDNTPPTISE